MLHKHPGAPAKHQPAVAAGIFAHCTTCKRRNTALWEAVLHFCVLQWCFALHVWACYSGHNASWRTKWMPYERLRIVVNRSLILLLLLEGYFIIDKKFQNVQNGNHSQGYILWKVSGKCESFKREFQKFWINIKWNRNSKGSTLSQTIRPKICRPIRY